MMFNKEECSILGSQVVLAGNACLNHFRLNEEGYSKLLYTVVK